jgi:hypothetical protein
MKKGSDQILVLLDKKIVTSSILSQYAVAAYCGLSLSTAKGIMKPYLSADQLMYYLSGNVAATKYTVQSLDTGIRELIENDIIFLDYENKKTKSYVLDCSNIWVDTSSDLYVAVTSDEMHKMMNVKNVSSFILLKYFIYIIGTINNNISVFLDNGDSKSHVVGNLTIDYISKQSNISQRTVIEYNKILETEGLLYISRQDDFVLNGENQIRQLPNVYGRPEDKDYIDTFAKNQKQYNKSFKYVSKDIEKVNGNRRLAQMYNQLYRENKYSASQIQEVYEYVVSENRKYEKLYEQNNYDSLLEKIRDIEIFKKYGIEI